MSAIRFPPDDERKPRHGRECGVRRSTAGGRRAGEACLRGTPPPGIRCRGMALMGRDEMRTHGRWRWSGLASVCLLAACEGGSGDSRAQPDARAPDAAAPDAAAPDAAAPDAAAPDAAPPCPDGPEACNGIDDDCDGRTDEDLGTTTCGVGGCEHDQPNCVDGGAVACDPSAGASDEVCDGVDNDCDGTVDEGHVDAEWSPDRDGDGHGASAGSSCASLFAEGAAEDGVYVIRPGGHDGPALRVSCDMSRDGGGWTRVFHHDVAGGWFASDADARARDVETPEGALYSILEHIEHFRSSDGGFVFRMEWPGTAIEGRNIWRQASNPTTAPVAGYEALDVDYAQQFWGGLELSDTAETFLDGSVGHPYWFYAIGAQVPWNDPPGIPAYTPQAERVSLWVRPDDAVAGGASVLACAGPPGYVDVAGDCDDTDPDVHAGAAERCNGADDDCDGEADEGCPFGDVALTTMPQPLHFYARDVGTDRCAFTVEGEAVGAASAVRVAVTRDGVEYAASVGDGPTFAIPVVIEAGLSRYDVSVAWSDGDGSWRPVVTAEDVVCGDVFLIDGQSNAVAIDYQGERLGDGERSPFVRSFGSAVQDASVADDRSFSIAVADAGYTRGAIGQWGLRLANRIKDARQVPILVINGAVGGTRVDQHQRNDADPEDLATIYGRMLWRARQAGVAGAVRAIFWHQGESDGGQPYATHLGLWTALYDDWLEDYPNVEGIFPFQVRAGCGEPTCNRNIHRELPSLLPRVLRAMSTTGVDGHDGCHFFHRTYAEWGDRMARVVLRDLYGVAVEGNIDAPDPASARWLSPTALEIDYGATGGGLSLQRGVEVRFSLSDGARIVGARVVGRTVVLTTAAPSVARWVSFVDVAGDIPWLVNDLGIGGFAYHQFPID